LKNNNAARLLKRRGTGKQYLYELVKTAYEGKKVFIPLKFIHPKKFPWKSFDRSVYFWLSEMDIKSGDRRWRV